MRILPPLLRIITKDGKVISWSLSVSDGETKYDLSSQSAPEYTEKGKDKDYTGLNINDPETFTSRQLRLASFLLLNQLMKSE